MKSHALALFTILVWSTTFVATKVLLAAGLMLSNRKGSRRGQRRGHASPSSS